MEGQREEHTEVMQPLLNSGCANHTSTATSNDPNLHSIAEGRSSSTTSLQSHDADYTSQHPHRRRWWLRRRLVSSASERNGNAEESPADGQQRGRAVLEYFVPQRKLGLFRGVYVPACIGLIGPNLFLRMSWVVGEAGLWLTIVIIAINFLLALMALSGISAIVTSGQMRSGGPYFLISRTLGPELGGAIGVLLVLEHVVACSYYLATFDEVIQIALHDVSNDSFHYDPKHGVMICSLVLLGCFVLALLGPRKYSTVAVAFFFVKLSALFVVIGSFLFRPPWTHEVPGPDTNATVHKFFTGPSLHSLSTNINEHEKEGELMPGSHFTDFLVLFSVIFASFSGLAAGANLTGDTKNAGSAIPKGIFAATVTGVVLFLVTAFAMALCVYKIYLLPNGARSLVMDVCINSWVVIVGMSACCVGTVVVHMLATANIIRLMNIDRMIPLLSRKWFDFLRTPGNIFVAVWPIVAAWLLVQIALVAGSPMAVAPLLSMAFLLLTSIVNAAVLFLVGIGAPNFRPTFRYWNWATALIGSVAPLAAMFGIDEQLSFIFIGVFVVLVVLYTAYSTPADLSEVSQAVLFHQIRRNLIKLGRKEQRSAKFWRPSPLLIEHENPDFLSRRALRLAAVVDEMKKGGLFVVASFVPGDFNAEALRQRESHLLAWREIIRRLPLKAIPVVNVESDAVHAVRNLALLTGIGSMRPNLAVLRWIGTTSAALPPVTFASVIKELMLTDMSVAVCRNFENLDRIQMVEYQKWMQSRRGRKTSMLDAFLPRRNRNRVERKMTVDVWPVPLCRNAEEDPRQLPKHFETSVGLCLQLASLLCANVYWKANATLRVCVPVQSEGHKAKEARAWQSFLGFIRINAIVEVFCISEAMEQVLGPRHPYDSSAPSETLSDNEDDADDVSSQHDDVFDADNDVAMIDINDEDTAAATDQSRSTATPAPEPVDEDDTRIPNPLAAPPLLDDVTGHSFASLPVAQQGEILSLLIRQKSTATSICLMPLPRFPKSKHNTLDLISRVDAATQPFPPVMLLHSKASVLHTEL